MSIMSVSEWRKKKEKEKEQGTVSSSAASTAASTQTTTGGESGKLMSPSEWKAKKATTSLEGWGSSANSLLEETQKYFGTWHNTNDEDGAYSSLRERRSSLLAQADSWRKQYADNEEAVSYINSVVSALSGLGYTAKDYFDYYSQLESDARFKNYDSKTAKSGWDTYIADKDRKQQEETEKPWYEKLLGYLGNASDTTLPGATMSQVVNYYRDDTSYREPSDSWDSVHRDAFGYLYAIDPEEAWKYAQEINDSLSRQEKDSSREKITEKATANFGSGVGHTVAAIGGGALGLADYLNDLAEYAGRGTITEKGGTLSPFEYSQAVTGGLSQHLNEQGGTLDEDIPIIGGKGWGDVYGLGISAAQSMVGGHVMGRAGVLISFFGSAAAGGIDEAKSRGATDEQALAFGTVSGAAEALTELVPIDNLLNMGPAANWNSLFANLIKQGGEEFLGEGANAIITSVADYLTFGDKSNYEVLKRYYMEELNFSEEDAANAAFTDIVEDVAFDALGGFVTGTFSAGVETGIQNGIQNISESQYYRKTYGDSAMELVQEGLESAEGSLSHQLAVKYQQKMDNGGTLTGAEIHRLIKANEQQFMAEDTDYIRQAAADRLTELGESENVAEIADILAKQATKQKLTKAEKQTLRTSVYGERVANELNPDSIRSGEYTTAWAEQIDTNRINAEEYSRILEAAQLPQEAEESTGEQAASKMTKAVQAAQVETVEATAANDQQITGKLTGKESLQVAEDGVTRQASTGKEVTPQKIVSIEGGKAMIQTDSGTIAADDIQFGTGDADLLWRSAASFNGINAAGANGIIRAYQSGQPVATYLHGATQEFQNGYYNMESGGEYADKLTPMQRSIIYELGKKAAGENTAKAQAIVKKSAAATKRTGVTGKVHFERNGRTFDQKRETALKTMEQLSSALGVEFYVYESYKNEAGQLVYKDASGTEVSAPNGYYDPKDGSIHIDLNAGAGGKGTMLFTIAHELTHFIKQWSPAKFKVLANFLVKQYSEQGVSVNKLVDAQIAKAKKNGRELSWDAAYEEVVADSMEAMLTDGNVVQVMADLKQQDKTLWQKICDWFKDLAADLKAVVDAYKGYKPDSAEGKMVADMQDIIVILESLYADALADAGENYQATKAEKNTTREGGEEMFSLRGENKDGIEVYETSEEIKKIPYTERQQRFLEIMKNEYRGRTAKFIRNGHAYYATFEEKDVNKNIYGDKRSDPKGWKAKINVGADGNIFELVENAQYNGSLPEQGKKMAAHKGVGYWDYFIKTVQIDDKVFDLVANVRKKADGAYVYSIQLNQNKTIEASPPRGSLLRALSGVPNASTDTTNAIDLRHKEARKGSYKAASQGDVVKNNVAQDSGNVKEKFSLRDTVEETKDLVAVHNLSEQKLIKSLQLGGLPMPSIAILRAQDGHSEFGDISLVFGKDTIDPQAYRTNKLYSGDAWTPTYPKVDFKPNEKVLKKVRDKISALVPYEVRNVLGNLAFDTDNASDYLSRYNGNMVEAYKRDDAMMYAYLKDTGSDITLPMKEEDLVRYGEVSNSAVRYFSGKLVNGLQTVELYQNMSARDLLQDKSLTEAVADALNYDVLRTLEPGSPEYMEYERNPLFLADEVSFRDIDRLLSACRKLFTNGVQQTVDRRAAKELVRDAVDQTAYESWLENLFAGVVEKEGIRNNKDYFTPSGNRRSFEALHYEHNLENVIRAMREKGDKGIGAFGGGSIFGAATTEFSSFEEMKQAGDRLQKISEEEYQQMRDAFSNRFFELASSLPNNKNSFSAVDDAANMLVEAVSRYTTKSGMANYIRRESKGWATYNDYVVDDLIELVQDIRNMPTGYFEAKPRRAVGFDEVATAIVPDTVSNDLKTKLEDMGIPFVEYAAGDEEARKTALNSIEGVKFSDRDSDGSELSAEQQEYFKDSKVRDEQGRLLVMYHGTPNGGFTKFRSGTYFTQNPGYAGVYQKPGASSISTKRSADAPMTYKVYLDIKKPFDTRNAAERKIFQQEFYRKYGTGTPLADSGLPDWVDGMDLQEFIEEMEYDYDGLILDEGGVGGYGEEVVSRGLSYVVFSSEQVKNADNKAPTDDPDIRYSDRDYMDAVEHGELGKAQSMVDHRAYMSGYNIKLHHGTAGEPFYVFRQGAEGIHFGTLAQATQRAKITEDRYSYQSKQYSNSEIRENPAMFPDSARRAIIEEIAYVLPVDLTAEEHSIVDRVLDNNEPVTDETLFHFIDKTESGQKYRLNNREMQRSGEGRVISAYVKAKNPLVFDIDIGEWTPFNIADILMAKINGEQHEIYDGDAAGWVKYDPANIQGIELTVDDLPQLQVLGQSRDFEDMAKFLQSKGIDSIRYLNTYEGTKNEESYILLSPEQVKSADPVTYDDNGNMIPLSERFNAENKDIRYSERDPELEKVNLVLAKENAELKYDIAYLKEMLKLQKQVTGGTKFTKTSVEAAAGQLMKYASAKGDKAELAGLLNGLYEYIAKGDELTWDGVVEAAQPAVAWLQSHVNIKTQRSSYAEDILREIRNSRISLDELQKKEVAYQYGSVNEFRKRAMGSVFVTDKDAISLDSQWHEWASQYPNIFDPDISSNDMPAALLDAFDTLRNMTDMDAYGYDQELFGQDLLRQVYDSYWNVSTLYTVADKAQKEINKLKYEHTGRMATLKKYHREKAAQLKQEHREALQKVKEAERERFDKKLQETQNRYQESRKKGAENRRKAEARRKIRRTVMDLKKILNRGDKKRNVKEDMKDLVAETLRSADILFTDNYSNEDMVRDGVSTEMTPQEAKYMTEAQDILAQIEGAGTAQERREAEERLKGKLDYRMGKLQDVFTRERTRLNKTKVSEVLGNLADAYASLENSEYDYVKGAFDENVHQYLTMLRTEVGGTIVKDMSLNQMEELHKAYTMVLTTVRNANRMFAANLKQTREQLGSQTIYEVMQAGGEHGLWLPGEDKVNAFSWNNQKPVYAFERIGSDTLKKLFENTRAGEDSWAQDMAEAREYYLERTRKYKYDAWDFTKQYNFTSTSGIDFSLNLEQIMSLYAYSKREQAHDHLMKGGFVFDGNTEVQVSKMGIKVTYLNKTAKAHNVSPEILGDIVSKLTKEQRAFVDEMQDYLSTTMGEKGNEVSMQMYGVKLFNEKHYFPLRSAGQYMERAKEADLKKEQGQISIVNSGFTKSTTPKSSNPVVLSGFMDVWASHVNEMSMYHSFVLPMEDFRRVYNYSSPNMETGQSVSVNSVIQDAYGEAATKYIDQLYRDLNGGAVSDPREIPAKALMGKFKKAAVFSSLSVVVQQPSAIGRAFAIVDPKYFVGGKVDSKRHKALWAELKQYAPVAAIKEMGYFDTGMGKSAQDFITGKEYGTIKEKAAALFTDEDYRDELLSKAPALADELTWCAIWEAVKRETKAKNKGMSVTSEEFLQIAGKRFTEVITKTQVYDSVLSRSANMRSKGALMSMWTAFMAEPTTTINMVEDALRKGKKGDKKYRARAMGAVLSSIILNSALVSLVYAMRDDDEDETFLEKYAQSFATEILDGINPLTYYPVLKDVWSALQGFDIERSDMSLITSLAEALTKLVQVLGKDTDDMDEDELAAHNKNLANAWWGVVDSVTALGGVPVKNVRRDINGAINMVKTIAADLTDRDTSWGSLLDNTWDDVKNTIPVVGWFPDATAADKLYKATVSGDTAYQKRLASAYSTESSLNSAIRKGLRSNDSRIWEAAIAWNGNDLETYKRLAKEIIAEGNFSQDNVVMAIQAEATALAPDDGETTTTSKAKGYFTAEKFAVAIAQGNDTMAAIIKADIIETAQKNGKTEEEAEKSFTSSAKSNMKEQFFTGEINENQAIDALTTYCGYEQENAEKTVGEWTFESEYGFTYSDRGEAYKSGAISADELRSILVSVGGKTEEEAMWQVKVYDWQNEGFDIDSNQKSIVIDYETFCEPAGIDKNTYFDTYLFYNVSGEEGVAYSKTVECMPYIDSLPLSSSQKTALALCWWSESTVNKYKLW